MMLIYEEIHFSKELLILLIIKDEAPIFLTSVSKIIQLQNS